MTAIFSQESKIKRYCGLEFFLFVSCNGPGIFGGKVGKIICVSCMVYVDWELGGQKNL